MYLLKRKRKIIWLFFIILLSPSLAHAYLDPGTGNLIINFLFGILAAAFFSLKGLFYFLIKRKKRSGTVKKEASEIAIFSEGKQYWGTFRPIVNNLINKNISFQYFTLDVEDPALTIESDLMASKFLGYGAFASIRFSQVEAKVMLSTTPNIGTPGYPIIRPSRIKKLVHVFHSINDISVYQKGSLDNYDAVIMVGDFQKKSIREIEKIRNLSEKELISLGLPYLDDLVENKKNINKESKTKTVLIGSSWGKKGCLRSYGTGFIRDIASAGYNVIVRPHPQSLKTEQPIISRFKQELIDMGNIIWDETISPASSMNKADILVSDTSSIRFDFAFIYEKPVITLDIKALEMPGFERDDLKEIWTDTSSYEIGFVIQRENIAQLLPCIEKALSDFNAEKISSVRDKTVINFGKSSDFITRFLSESIKEGN